MIKGCLEYTYQENKFCTMYYIFGDNYWSHNFLTKLEKQ